MPNYRDINQVILTGRLKDDPEYTDDNEVCRGAICRWAPSRPGRNDRQRMTLEVTVNLPKQMAADLRKDDRVMVQGSLRERRFMDPVTMNRTQVYYVAPRTLVRMPGGTPNSNVCLISGKIAGPMNSFTGRDGSKLLEFDIAVQNTFEETDENGETQTRQYVDRFPVRCRESVAEAAQGYKSGDSVLVSGFISSYWDVRGFFDFRIYAESVSIHTPGIGFDIKSRRRDDPLRRRVAGGDGEATENAGNTGFHVREVMRQNRERAETEKGDDGSDEVITPPSLE